MDYHFQFRDKIRVAVQGAKTEAGQYLNSLLARHLWFDLSDTGEGALTFFADKETLVSVGKEGPKLCLLPDLNSEELNGLPRSGVKLSHPSGPATALALALKPLHSSFGLLHVHVITLMSAQGDKISSLDLLDNVIPETDSIAEEVKQLLGLSISTQTVRVPMSSGILQYVSVGFNNTPTKDEIIGCWEAYQGGAVSHKLPSAPDKLLHYFEGERQPQPKLCQDVDRGRGVSIGALTHGGPYDYQFAIASNPTIRGPLGGAILNAELLVRLGFVFW